MTLLCPRCGAHNEDERKACAACGSSLAGALPVGATASPDSSSPSGADAAGSLESANSGTAPRQEGPAPVSGGPTESAGSRADGIRPVAEGPARGALPELPPLARHPAAPGESAPAGTVSDDDIEALLTGGAAPGDQATEQQPLPGEAGQEPPGPAGEAAPGPTAYPVAGYPVNMPYGYPSWREGVGYLPSPGYGFMPPSMYGPYGGFPPYGFFPPMPWPAGFPPYGMGMPYYPAFQPPAAYPGAYGAQPQYPGWPYPQAYPAGRTRLKAVSIVLIVVGVLLLIGGAVTAAVLLTGNSKSSFALGDGSVTGADIEFNDLVLKQSGSTVTLTGTYDNNTKREGDVFVTVEASGQGGSEQLLSFTVPVTTGKGHSVNQKKSSSTKISGATLGALIFQGGSSSDDGDEDTYPWDTTPDNKSTSPYDDGETTPYTTSPRTYPDSTSAPYSND